MLKGLGTWSDSATLATSVTERVLAAPARKDDCPIFLKEKPGHPTLSGAASPAKRQGLGLLLNKEGPT